MMKRSKTATYVASALLGVSALFLSPKEVKAWEVPLCNRFNTSSGISSDYLFIGVSPIASDNFLIGEDSINPPPIDEDFGDLTSLVDGYRLMSDIRGQILSLTKSWYPDLIVGSETSPSLSGTNLVIADLSNLPGGYGIHLLDYGNDFSRTSPLAIHDFRADPNYFFPVVDQFGLARALEVRVTIPEPSAGLLALTGVGFLARRQRRN